MGRKKIPFTKVKKRLVWDAIDRAYNSNKPVPSPNDMLKRLDVWEYVLEKEKTIIQMLYGYPPFNRIYEEKEIAEQFKQSKQNINAIKKKAFAKLKIYLAEKELRHIHDII